MEQSKRIAHLIFLLETGTISEPERMELQDWIDASPENKLQFEQLTDPVRMKYFLEFDEKMQNKMHGQASKPKVITLRVWQRYAAASVLVLITLGIGMQWFKAQRNGKDNSQEHQAASDVAPGKFNALLTLSDGRKIVLDSAGSGLLAKQENTSIYNDDGLAYNSERNENTEVVYNTLETSTGQTYTLKLSDGTKVWLNSKSAITFPVSFNSAERKIEMKGEVYFEVTKDTKRPFVAKILDEKKRDVEIRVLGTHFNINAYDDEPTLKTTLLEGSIRFVQSVNNKSKLLMPLQQAALDQNGNLTVFSNVNTEAAVSWKDQTFFFQDNDVKSVMRELSRWYGIEVVYEGELNKAVTISGMVSKKRNLSEVLKALEQVNVHFTIERNRLTVKP